MKHSIVSALLLVPLLLSGCVTAAPPPASINSPQAAAAATSVPAPVLAEPADTAGLAPTDTATPALETPAPTDTSTPELETPDPTNTPVPVILTPSELFDKVSPSIAFVETDRSSGSGVLIEDGYIVTNAHVVWPFKTVRVVFPDGSEFKDAPVLAWDLIADLAVVGPVETELSPVTFLTDERLLVGKDVFLIGYPGEVEEFPQPTISRGLVSRLRSWPAIDMTYLQTDATIAGGQSGGVLVTEQGEVAGISGNTFPDTSFALAASAEDVSARVQRLLAGEDIDGLGQRPVLDEEGASTSHMLVLRSDTPSSTYAVHGDIGDEIDVSVEGIPDFAILAVDSYGEPVAWADDTYTGKEHVTFELGDSGLYFIDVFVLEGGSAIGTIKSNATLIPLQDGDDQTSPTINKTIAGALDYPSDLDPYRISLQKNQEINVRVESVMVDPYLTIHIHEVLADGTGQPVDDDSGDGLFGLDAEMSYRAPETGAYYIIVGSQVANEAGGYLLTVSEVEEGDPTPMAPAPTPTPIHSALGQMTVYQSEELPGFRLQLPLDWEEGPPGSDYDELCRVANCWFTDDGQVLLLINEEQVSGLSAGNAALESVAAAEERLLGVIGDLVDIKRSEQIKNAHGVSAWLIEYELPVGVLRVRSYLSVNQGAVLKVSFIMPAVWDGADAETARLITQSQDEIGRIADYMINTLQVVD